MDRLAELQRYQGCGPAAMQGISPNGIAIEMKNADDFEADTANPIMDQFFGLVCTIQTGIRTIETSTASIADLHSQILRASDASQTQRLNAELSLLIDQIQACAAELKSSLGSMEKQIGQLQNSPDAQSHQADIRIQKNQHATLTRKFVAVMRHYHNTLGDNKRQCSDAVARRLKAKAVAEGGELDDTKAHELALQVLETGCQDAVLMRSRDVLLQVEENHRDYVRLERAMRDLHQIFSDMAVLVEEQGNQIDDILDNVQTANAHVEAARRNLRQARKYSKKSRKKMFIILLVIVCLVCAILIPAVLIPTLR